MRWLAILAFVSLLAACGGDEPSSLPTGDEVGDRAATTNDAAADDTDSGGTAPDGTDSGDSATEPEPEADCTPEAMLAAVSAALNPEGSIPGTVTVRECQGRYARIFYEPEASNLETEQVFLVDTGGDWTVLTFGTGIDCATETDWRPAQLEDACSALGLR